MAPSDPLIHFLLISLRHQKPAGQSFKRNYECHDHRPKCRPQHTNILHGGKWNPSHLLLDHAYSDHTWLQGDGWKHSCKAKGTSFNTHWQIRQLLMFLWQVSIAPGLLIWSHVVMCETRNMWTDFLWNRHYLLCKPISIVQRWCPQKCCSAGSDSTVLQSKFILPTSCDCHYCGRGVFNFHWSAVTVFLTLWLQSPSVLGIKSLCS